MKSPEGECSLGTENPQIETPLEEQKMQEENSKMFVKQNFVPKQQVLPILDNSPIYEQLTSPIKKLSTFCEDYVASSNLSSKSQVKNPKLLKYLIIDISKKASNLESSLLFQHSGMNYQLSDALINGLGDKYGLARDLAIQGEDMLVCCLFYVIFGQKDKKIEVSLVKL